MKDNNISLEELYKLIDAVNKVLNPNSLSITDSGDERLFLFIKQKMAEIAAELINQLVFNCLEEVYNMAGIVKIKGQVYVNIISEFDYCYHFH